MSDEKESPMSEVSGIAHPRFKMWKFESEGPSLGGLRLSRCIRKIRVLAVKAKILQIGMSL